MADKKPLLDILTGYKRETIVIDGISYELKSYDELGIVEFHKLMRMGEGVQKILAKPKLTEVDAKELAKISKSLVAALVVDLPAKVNDKLNDSQRAAIFSVFTNLSPAMPPATGE